MPKKRPFSQFGQVVRRRRIALSLSLEQLSERADLTANYLGTIEQGHRDPSLSTIAAIARGLDLPPGELLGSVSEFGPKAFEMAKLFDEVSPAIQEAVLLILQGASLVLKRETVT